MSIRVEIHQKQTILEGPLYKVETEVTYAAGIDRHIFVFDVETQTFAHVARVWDMENLPSNYEDALAEDLDYYRLDACEKSYEAVTDAVEFSTYTRGRIQSLVNAYEIATETFEGESDYTFTNG